jgi:hypothetical protein
MPYISQTDRQKFENLVKTMHLTDIKTAGELNYLITQLVHGFLEQKPQGYQNYNDAMGALAGAQMELYRHDISKYEDIKISLNGDVP